MADADACGKCGIRVRGRLAEDASRNAVQPIVHLRRFGPSDAVDDVPHIYSPPAAGATDRLAQRDKSQNAKIAKVFCVFFSNKEVLSSFLNLSAHTRPKIAHTSGTWQTLLPAAPADQPQQALMKPTSLDPWLEPCAGGHRQPGNGKPKAARNAFGSRLIASGYARVGPSGARRLCSKWCNVLMQYQNRPANAYLVISGLARIDFTPISSGICTP